MFEISLPDLLFLINVPLQSRSISSLFHRLMPKKPPNKPSLISREKNNTNHSVHIKKNHGAQAVNGHRTIKRISAANHQKLNQNLISREGMHVLV